MTDADGTREELAGINRLLSDLPEDAYGERARLRSRQHELRAESVPALVAELSTRQLEEELDRLQRRRRQLLGRRISAGHVGLGGGPGGGGFDPVQLAEMNADIDSASGVHEVEDLIERIDRELEARRQP